MTLHRSLGLPLLNFLQDGAFKNACPLGSWEGPQGERTISCSYWYYNYYCDTGLDFLCCPSWGQLLLAASRCDIQGSLHILCGFWLLRGRSGVGQAQGQAGTSQFSPVASDFVVLHRAGTFSSVWGCF